jgi:hypothetical protein
VTAPSRHLSLGGFAEYLRRGVPMRHAIDGTPRLILVIEPGAPAIALRGPIGERGPRPSGLQHVRTLTAQEAGERFLEVRVTDPALFADAYAMFCSIADRAQLHGVPFGHAITDTLRLFGVLLQRHGILSRERELGLSGELLTLIGLCGILGPETAVAAWRGPHGEEHDFGLTDIDLEAKTTASERRAHWIDSLTQLEPTGSRPLWLVSHQLTEAGADKGWSLPDLVAAAREAVGEQDARVGLEERLAAAGWADALADRHSTRWRRRFASSGFLVGGDFPRLTSGTLAGAGAETSKIVEVRYRVDLTDYVSKAPLPPKIANAIAAEVSE